MSEQPYWVDQFIPPPPPKPRDESWLDAFAPKTPAPTAPQTVTESLPAQEGHSIQVFEAILGYNNGLDQFANNATSWSNVEEGVVIHKITQDQAMAISTRIKPVCEQYQLPLTYALACLAIESTLDPNCQNANIGTTSTGVARSNPTNDPLGYDMGIAQLKLRYLVGAAPGCTDADSARAFAIDVNRAIPYFASLMASKILWATNIIERDTSSAPDSRLRNPLLLSTGAYNFGETGMLAYFEAGSFPSHCQRVVDLTNYFDKVLGNPNPVFPGIPSTQQA